MFRLPMSVLALVAALSLSATPSYAQLEEAKKELGKRVVQKLVEEVQAFAEALSEERPFVRRHLASFSDFVLGRLIPLPEEVPAEWKARILARLDVAIKAHHEIIAARQVPEELKEGGYASEAKLRENAARDLDAKPFTGYSDETSIYAQAVFQNLTVEPVKLAEVVEAMIQTAALPELGVLEQRFVMPLEPDPIIE